MCVLSLDNESKRVFERLYETGVIQVKKKLEEQEEKRIKDSEVVITFITDNQTGRKKLYVYRNVRVITSKRRSGMMPQSQNIFCARMSLLLRVDRSATIASGRKCDNGNYGEFLYNEGIKSKHVKAEQARHILNQRQGEELDGNFTPQINEVSKNLRRDMPVVERLLMLEQVSASEREPLPSFRSSITPQSAPDETREDRAAQEGEGAGESPTMDRHAALTS
jgi:hypothetical protein